MAVFQASFHSSDATFDVSFVSDCVFHIGFGNTVVVPVADYYDGEYEVTPRLYQQELATRGLAMSDDVTVKKIPVVYTSNLYDGKTVMIG